MNSTSDDLPPELESIGKRMTTERPVASDATLDSVMTRVQSNSKSRRSSLLWRSSRPRKTFAVGLAALTMSLGVASAASAFSLSGLFNGLGNSISSILDPDDVTTSAVVVVDIDAFCANPQQVTVLATLLNNPLLAATIEGLLGLGGSETVTIIDIGPNIGGLVELQVCVAI